MIGNQQYVCDLIALADSVRRVTKDVTRDLKELCSARVVMLTRDNEATARVISKDAGADAVRAGSLSEERVAAVEGLVAEFGSVAMVGDRMNVALRLEVKLMCVTLTFAGYSSLWAAIATERWRRCWSSSSGLRLLGAGDKSGPP